jgi:hypothetical protein
VAGHQLVQVLPALAPSLAALALHLAQAADALVNLPIPRPP